MDFIDLIVKDSSVHILFLLFKMSESFDGDVTVCWTFPEGL